MFFNVLPARLIPDLIACSKSLGGRRFNLYNFGNRHALIPFRFWVLKRSNVMDCQADDESVKRKTQRLIWQVPVGRRSLSGYDRG